MINPFQSKVIAERSISIDIGYLFKNGYIEKHCEIFNNLSWKDSTGKSRGTIRIESSLIECNNFIRLIYTLSDETGLSKDFNYKINLLSVPSNLGSGKIFYFECPFTKRRCRVLYLASGSHYFKSRYAYGNYIFYKSQVCSKREYANTRYWKLKDEYDKLTARGYRESYNGKQTRSFSRIKNMKNKIHYFDYVRFQNLNQFLSKLKS